MREEMRAQGEAPVDSTRLAQRLEQTEEMLRAIQEYLVDAFVVRRGEETEVVLLDGANYPYRAMVECMNEGAVTLIPDGTIMYTNPRFSEMVGIEPGDLIGSAFRALLPAGQRQGFDSLLAQAGLGGSRAEFILKGPKGAQVPVQLSIFLLAAAGSAGVSILITDVSDRVAAEKQIRALASRLATAEQEERLRLSQVLHDDLLQRLFALKAQLCLLQDVTQKDSTSASVKTELGYMDEWLNQTISMTRGLSIELIPAVLESEGLAEAITWMAPHLKKQAGIQITVEVRAGFPTINGALRTLLFQALRDLIFGLARDSETRDCSIVLEQKGREARITLESAGEAFDGGTSMNDPDRDYGLALIRDRLGIMGCSLKISSKPGKGTRAVIRVPLGKAPART